MTEQQVLQRFCALATTVASMEFKHKEPSDCFCNEERMSINSAHFQFSEHVMVFIETAVKEKLNI